MYSSSRTLKVSHYQPVSTGKKELVLRVTTYLGSKLADRFDAEHLRWTPSVGQPEGAVKL